MFSSVAAAPLIAALPKPSSAGSSLGAFADGASGPVSCTGSPVPSQSQNSSATVGPSPNSSGSNPLMQSHTQPAGFSAGPTPPLPDQADRPIPFIQVSDDGHFSIAEDAVRVLQSIQGPVAIVSVVGMYRTGKSFLLNQLLTDSRQQQHHHHQQQHFEVGPSVNPCTRGLWMWSRPLQLDDTFSSTGHPLNVLLIDTEGIASFTQNEDHDVKIFSLAVLLSSFLVYNSMGTIDETAIERLSLVAELSKHIRLHSNYGNGSTSPGRSGSLSPRRSSLAGAGAPSSSSLSSSTTTTTAAAAATAAAVVSGSAGFENKSAAAEKAHLQFPTFLWLLRDFTLQLRTPDNREMTPRQYLELALSPQPGESEKVGHKNKIRQAIREHFVDRDCFALVRPVHDENDLQTFYLAAKRPTIRAEFAAQMQSLRSRIFDRLQAKRIHGKDATGSMLLGLANAYLQAMNGGKVPTITTAFEQVMSGECAAAYTLAARHVRSLCHQLASSGTGNVETAIARIETEGRQIFQQRAFGPHKDRYEQDLQSLIADETSLIRKSAAARAREMCEAVISQLSRDFVGSDEDLSSLDHLLDAFIARTSALGDAIPPAVVMSSLVGFVRKEWMSMAQQVISQHIERVTATEAAKQKELSMRLEHAESDRTHYKSLVDELRLRLEAAAGELRTRSAYIDSLEKVLQERQAQQVGLESDVARLETLLAEATRASEAQSQRMLAEIRSCHEKLDATETQLVDCRKELEVKRVSCDALTSELELREEALRSAEAREAVLSAREAALEAEIGELSVKMHRASDAFVQLERRMTESDRHAKELHASLAASQKELQGTQDMLRQSDEALRSLQKQHHRETHRLQHELRQALEQAQRAQLENEHGARLVADQEEAFRRSLVDRARRENETAAVLGELQARVASQRTEIGALREQLVAREREIQDLLAATATASAHAVQPLGRSRSGMHAASVAATAAAAATSSMHMERPASLLSFDTDGLLDEIYKMNEVNRRTLAVNRKLIEENDTLKMEIGSLTNSPEHGCPGAAVAAPHPVGGRAGSNGSLGTSAMIMTHKPPLATVVIREKITSPLVVDPVVSSHSHAPQQQQQYAALSMSQLGGVAMNIGSHPYVAGSSSKPSSANASPIRTSAADISNDSRPLSS